MSLPERLGRLTRIERVGVGGFASVWRYYDEELESDVAVKALADNWAQRLDVRERFLEEARLLRKADADHIVRVYDIGETEDGTPYFVMTYADRGTVADLLNGPVPVEQALNIIEQAGLGLEVLHRSGIIHRDIKPQNLLFKSRPDGGVDVLVADLGVAKAVSQASGLTQVVGTPAYMAPEQASGDRLDIRADVHALGAVGYVLLTGRTVRPDGLADLLYAKVPPAPSSIADVPERLDYPILCALDPDPDRRWPDVPSFINALHSNTSPYAGASPTMLAAAKPQGARRVLAPALLFVIVMLAAFAAAYAVTMRFN